MEAKEEDLDTCMRRWIHVTPNPPKRPTMEAKETYYGGKRNPPQPQKLQTLKSTGRGGGNASDVGVGLVIGERLPNKVCRSLLTLV
jgi:hypothetical protein